MISNIKILQPIGFSGFQFYKKFGEAADKSTKHWEKLFKFTHNTWDGHPSWDRKKSVGANMVEFTTETDDKIYRFLNYGTEKRYAVMPQGWISKTAPGRLFPGQGGSSFDRSLKTSWDWREWAARSRAIEARWFDKTVKKKSGNSIVKYFQTAMTEGVVASGHKYN